MGHRFRIGTLERRFRNYFPGDSRTFAKKLAARGKFALANFSPKAKMAFIDFSLLGQGFQTVCVVHGCDVTLALCAKAYVF